MRNLKLAFLEQWTHQKLFFLILQAWPGGQEGLHSLQFSQLNHRIQSDLMFGLRLTHTWGLPVSVSPFSNSCMLFFFLSCTADGERRERGQGEEVLTNLQNTEYL